MKTEIETITEKEILGKSFTVYGTIEEPLFLAKDVAELLEHSDVSTMIKTVDDDEKLMQTIFVSGQNREVWLLTEGGLYEVLMLSRKPIAKEFKKKVKKILHDLRTGKVEIVPVKNQKELEIAERTTKLKEAEYWERLAERYADNKTYEQILIAYSTKAVAGEFVLPLPELEEKNYSATEIGKMFNVSANKIGAITNKLKLKGNPEYSKTYVDKARHSSKEVNTYRYNQKAIDLIKKELGV